MRYVLLCWATYLTGNAGPVCCVCSAAKDSGGSAAL